MAEDHYVPEHKRYSERLAALEKKSAQARQQKNKTRRPIGKRLPRLRWHHYKKNGERVGSLVLLFGFILALMAYIISPLSKVTTIKVIGNSDLRATQVEQATQVYPGRFIWGVLLTKKSLCKQARFKQPQINHVQIKLTGPQSLQLSVSENALIGAARLGQQNYAVLSNGHLQATNATTEGTIYRSFTGHRAKLVTVAKQIGKLKPAIRHDISVVSYQPTKDAPERIILYMNDGNTVLANYRTVGKKMTFYPSIVANMKKTGIIDLQVGAYSYDYGSKDK